MALAKSLEKNTSLRRLVMGDNPMGDVAGTAFANALRTNTTLQEVPLLLWLFLSMRYFEATSPDSFSLSLD